MNQERGTFVPPEPHQMQGDGHIREHKDRLKGMPTLGLDEIVQIKGIYFKVITIKKSGVVRLKMLDQVQVNDHLDRLRRVQG